MQPDRNSGARDLYLELLKRVLTNTIYGDANISPGAAIREFRPELREDGRDWPAVAHTMVGRLRLDNLQWSVESVLERNVPGDFIETGVWRGGASILMRGILKAWNDDARTVWVADSFEGLPEPDPVKFPADRNDAHHAYAELAVSLEEVQENFRRYDLLDDRVRFVKGWFRETLPSLATYRFALVRLDGDMYESTMVALQSLYPALASGGILIVDDYGAIEGCRAAIDDYRDEQGIKEPMRSIDWTGVFWIKDAVAASAIAGSAVGSIDVPAVTENGCAQVRCGDPLIVAGWIADGSPVNDIARVLILVDDRSPVRATYGLGRTDVAIAHESTAFQASGFSVHYPTLQLATGTHRLKVVGVARDGTWRSFTNGNFPFIVT